MRPPLHICIATGQNLANLIPSLQLGARQVVILETAAMRASAGNLQVALRSRGVAAVRVPFDDSTPDAIVRSSEEIATRFGEQPILLNITGGHKLMTLALAEQMPVADDLHVVYAETRHDRLDWLKPRAEIEPMQDVLRLEDILLAHGYRKGGDGLRDVAWQQTASERESLTRWLGEEAARLAPNFGVLNSLSDQALATGEANLFRASQRLPYTPGGTFSELLRRAQDKKLLHWDGETDIHFAAPEAAAYFRGGWLEEYVWLKLRGLKPRDWSVRLEVKTIQGETLNELDAVVVHRNRLLVIECKTRRFGRDFYKDADHIYKLAQLSRQLGGIMSGSLLLSAREISPEVRARAQESNVEVLAAADVGGLTDYLRRWMRA
jgi:Holliday junction resolvase